MQYKIVHLGSSVDLTEKVNELLNEGWELYGDPIASNIQAMIKKDSPPPTKVGERFYFEFNPVSGQDKLFYKAENGKTYRIDPEKFIKKLEPIKQ